MFVSNRLVAVPKPPRWSQNASGFLMLEADYHSTVEEKNNWKLVSVNRFSVSDWSVGSKTSNNFKHLSLHYRFWQQFWIFYHVRKALNKVIFNLVWVIRFLATLKSLWKFCQEIYQKKLFLCLNMFKFIQMCCTLIYCCNLTVKILTFLGGSYMHFWLLF